MDRRFLERALIQAAAEGDIATLLDIANVAMSELDIEDALYITDRVVNAIADLMGCRLDAYTELMLSVPPHVASNIRDKVPLVNVLGLCRRMANMSPEELDVFVTSQLMLASHQYEQALFLTSLYAQRRGHRAAMELISRMLKELGPENAPALVLARLWMLASSGLQGQFLAGAVEDALERQPALLEHITILFADDPGLREVILSKWRGKLADPETRHQYMQMLGNVLEILSRQNPLYRALEMLKVGWEGAT